MKKKKWIMGFIAIVAVGVIAVFLTGSSGEGEKNTTAFDITAVVRRDLNSSVLATGIVRPCVGAEVKVGSQVSGIVQQLFVDIGDPVKKGQLLAVLEPTQYRASYNQALAALEVARADLRYNRLNLDRQRFLFKEDTVSRDTLDTAETSYETAKARVSQAEANAEYAKIQLGYTRIYAPISGVVSSIATQVGETVAASFAAPTFVTIIDLNRLEVWAYVDETDIGRVRIGQQTRFTVDTYTDTDFEGQVTAIYPKAEIQENVVNYVTVITVTAKKDRILRPEMTTTVNILLQTRKNVLTVPNRAIHRENGGKFVYILENQQPRKHPVKTGWKNRDHTEITSGLAENDRVIAGDIY